MTDRRRAIAFNALGRALRDADRWLPFSTRRAAVDSVLAAVDAEDQAGARPHACGNCEGIDPSSCIANPNRATRQTTPPRCTCARAWNFHSRDCARYVEGHELASPELAAARQTTGQDDTACSLPGFAGCECNHLTGCEHPAPAGAKPDPAVVEQFIQHMATQPDPTTADDPVPLRWGLGDVMHGDDDSVIICLSGLEREPYWLELDPDRRDALRDDLTPSEDEQLAEIRRDIHEALVVLPAPEADRIRALVARLEAAARTPAGQPADAMEDVR